MTEQSIHELLSKTFQMIADDSGVRVLAVHATWLDVSNVTAIAYRVENIRLETETNE